MSMVLVCSSAFLLISCWEGCQIRSKSIEMLLPFEAALVDPLLRLGQSLRLDLASACAPDLLRADQAGLLEYREMLHDCR